MFDALKAQEFQESRIENEPILGPVLVFPGGRIQSLTLFERVLVTLGLTNAKRLERRYTPNAPK
jgi:hypothetical protein